GGGGGCGGGGGQEPGPPGLRMPAAATSGREPDTSRCPRVTASNRWGGVGEERGSACFPRSWWGGVRGRSGSTRSPPLLNDRAPSFETPVPRSPSEASSGQVLPRHTNGTPYRCSLPGLAGFDAARCLGPHLQHPSARLIRHERASRGNSTPL